MRKTSERKSEKDPKICLDATNTNPLYLEISRRLIKKVLNIESNYSIQKPKENRRRIAFHLRIYKKDFVRKFLENVKTTKLKQEKLPFVKSGYTEPRLILAFSQHHPNSQHSTKPLRTPVSYFDVSGKTSAPTYQVREAESNQRSWDLSDSAS
jgi:hypothetical protein